MRMYQFEVNGSAAEPYQVKIAIEHGSLTASCTCPAGRFGSICKHRLAIMTGDSSAVVGDNASDVAALLADLEGTEVHQAVAALNDAEADLSKAKRAVEKAKKALASMLG